MRLQLRNISKSFDGRAVLKHLDLEVQDRELLAVLGSSGAGKSTLLRLIAGFETPDQGEIRLGEQVVSGPGFVLEPEKRKVGIVPQSLALFPHLSVAQNISFGLAKKDTTRVKELLELIGLSEYANRKPAVLSGGQQQRVALARALAPRPSLVLLDEPFAALDVDLRVKLREEVKNILKHEGVTAILVTHDQEEALSLADKVAVLRDGEIAQIGAPTEIYNAPADVGIATFLGDAVVIAGKVLDGKVLTDLGRLTPLNQVAEGMIGKVAIRSENFYLQPNPGGDSTVVGRKFFGHDTVLEVQTPKVLIRARSNGPFAPEVGMKVTVWVRGSVNFYPDFVD